VDDDEEPHLRDEPRPNWGGHLTPYGRATFKIVRMHGSKDEVIARVENFLICKAAFEKALFVYPDAHLEMRQGARIILKSKEVEAEKKSPGSSRG